MKASKDDYQYLLRLPEGIRELVKARAEANGHSMNTEIIRAIAYYLKVPTRIETLEKRIDRLETSMNCPYFEHEGN